MIGLGSWWLTARWKRVTEKFSNQEELRLVGDTMWVDRRADPHREQRMGHCAHVAGHRGSILAEVWLDRRLYSDSTSQTDVLEHSDIISPKGAPQTRFLETILKRCRL
jgi:hypothetical protein